VSASRRFPLGFESIANSSRSCRPSFGGKGDRCRRNLR
jgi:hypothetical protein